MRMHYKFDVTNLQRKHLQQKHSLRKQPCGVEIPLAFTGSINLVMCILFSPIGQANKPSLEFWRQVPGV